MSITILGVNGFLGKHVLNALTSPEFYPHLTRPIVVLTRDISKVDQSIKQVTYKQVASPAEWDPILKDTDIFINLAGDTQDHNGAVEAFKRNPPRLYIPSQFGCDPHQVLSRYKSLPFLAKVAHTNAVRALGIKVVDIYNGAFDDRSDALLTEWFGPSYDQSTKTFTHFGSGDVVFTTSVLADIGKSVAAIVTFHEPSTLPDQIHIASNLVTVNQVISRYEKAHSVEVKTQSIPIEEARAKTKAIGESGKFDILEFLYQLHTIVSDGPGKGISWSLEEREIINPGEKYFKWTPFA